MQEDNKVIKFPNSNDELTAENTKRLEEYKQLLTEARESNNIVKGHAEETDNLISSIVMEHMILAGIDLQNPKNIKDLLLVIAAIKSLIYKHYKLFHPVQTISEELFTVKPDGTSFINMKKSFASADRTATIPGR